MKKIVFLFIVTLILLSGYSQSVGIGTATPNSSAALQISSTTKGLLIPSMTSTQRGNIISPADGLLVYDITFHRLYQYQQGTWKYLTTSDLWTGFPGAVYNIGDNIGINTAAPAEKLHVVGNAILGGGNPTLQLQNGGADKGFVQLSGDDMRIGTNSSNTAGKFVVRTNGADQLEIDGTTTNNVMRLYASGVHRGTISALNNNNLSLTTQNPNGLLMLNGQIYINNTIDKTGIGTTTPTEKLHVLGNVKIEFGKLLQPATGSFDMMPLCYGRINADGSIHTATPNVSVTRTSAGTYEINCSGITAGSVIALTVYGDTRYIGAGSYVSSGKMRVIIENITEVIDDPGGFHSNDDKTFYFVIYN